MQYSGLGFTYKQGGSDPAEGRGGEKVGEEEGGGGEEGAGAAREDRPVAKAQLVTVPGGSTALN